MVETPKWPQLAQGQSGPNVRALQLLLRYRGANISVDGGFGPNTYNAVLNFQNKNSLRYKDGIAGEETLSALITTIVSRTINDAAWAAQTLLAKFETLTVDSDFWSGSEKATKNFQTKMGFSSSQITGTVTPITWRYLFGYDNYPNPEIAGNVYASVAQTNSTLSSNQMHINAVYVYAYLTQSGFSKNAACAVLGNMQFESDIDPAVWQVLNNINSGYGLVQWDPATKFLNRAVTQGTLSSATASAVNALANSNPKELMNAELSFLLWDCMPAQSNFFAPAAYMQHSGLSMSFATFKKSTADAGTLAIAFHDHYERSNDNMTRLNKRRDLANYWYNYF